MIRTVDTSYKKREHQASRKQQTDSARVRSLARFVRLLRANAPELIEQYGARSLGVFGSYVRGDQRPRSDLDILVQEDHTSFRRSIELEDYLHKLLGVKVDLVPERQLKPYIGKNVRAEVVWLWRDGQIVHAKIPRVRGNGKRNSKMAKPKREYLDYLNDILTNMEMAEKFCAGLADMRVLYDNPEKAYATAKAVENIGEAVKKVPTEVKKRFPHVDWKGIAGMRDKIAHDYFDINYEKLWEVVTQDIPRDKPFVKEMVEQELAARRAQESDEK